MKKCDVKGCKANAKFFSRKSSLCEEHWYQLRSMSIKG